jgi:hypothetical protein
MSPSVSYGPVPSPSNGQASSAFRGPALSACSGPAPSVAVGPIVSWEDNSLDLSGRSGTDLIDEAGLKPCTVTKDLDLRPIEGMLEDVDPSLAELATSESQCTLGGYGRFK